MYRLTRFPLPLFMLFAAALFLTACESDPDRIDDVNEDDIVVEDDMNAMNDGMGTETGYFDTWDTNRDTYLDQNEYTTNYGQTGLYDTYDTNRDTYLDEDEFSTGYVGAGFDTAENFSNYDTDGDGRISREEFQTGLFNRMDTDGDGRVSREEFRRYESMMGGMGTGAPGTGTGTGATGTPPTDDPGL